MKERRDFIDFLCLMYDRRKILYVILLLILSSGYYYDSNNIRHKFTSDMHVSLKDAFYKSDSYQQQLVLMMYEGDSQIQLPPNYLTELVWSRPQARDLMHLLGMNSEFFNNLAVFYIKNHPESELSVSEVSTEIMSAIKYKKDGDYGMSMKFSLENKELGHFLHENFINFMSQYISEKLHLHMVNIKDSASRLFQNRLMFVQSNKIKTISDGGLKPVVNQKEYLRSKISLIESLVIPSVSKINFFNHATSTYQKTGIINPAILYFILIFFSFFLHVFFAILYDLKEQTLNRKKISSLM